MRIKRMRHHLDGTWEDGLPRLSAIRKNRASRVKCLVNAVAPRVTALLWRRIAGAVC